MNALPKALASEPEIRLPQPVEDSRSPRLVAQWIRAHLLEPGAELRSITPVFSRFKGADGGLVTYRVDLSDAGQEVSTFVSVRTGPPWRLVSQAERFKDPVHRSSERLLKPSHLDPDLGVLLLSFPLDRELGTLRRALRPKWVRRWLEGAGMLPSGEGARLSVTRSRVVVLSYRPERRAVLRLDAVMESAPERTQHLFLRLYADPERAAATVRSCTALRAAGVPTPQPLGQLRPDLIVEGACTGAPLPPSAVTNAAMMRALGRLVAAAHSVSAPEGSVQLHNAAVPEASVRCAKDLELIHPGLGAWARSCVEALGSMTEPAGVALLHGDLHPGQVLIDGARLSLVDWDRSAAGDPAYDLGTLAAHLTFAHGRRAHNAMEHVTEGYREAGGTLEAERQRWHAAHALLRLITTPFRTLRPDWPECTERILAQVEEVAEC